MSALERSLLIRENTRQRAGRVWARPVEDDGDGHPHLAPGGDLSCRVYLSHSHHEVSGLSPVWQQHRGWRKVTSGGFAPWQGSRQEEAEHPTNRVLGQGSTAAS